jgi:DNA (cytosine-5)-methyltransferase 1
MADPMRKCQQGIVACSTYKENRKGSEQRPNRPRSNGDGWWSTEPALGRVAHGVANRVNRIKALGNGQVPLQAAMAYRILEARYAGA